MSKPICLIVGYGPGVGHGTAEAFAGAGFELVLFSRRGRPTLSPVNGHSVQVDAGNPRALVAALERAIHQFGPPTVLLYNAVAFRLAPPSQLKAQDLLDDLGTNVVGAMVAAQTVLPAMLSKGGSLLFTGGGWSLYPDPAVASTAIGKASLRHLALMLAQELKETRVKVGTLTILGQVESGGAFDPTKIGQAFLEMHQSQLQETEVRFTGQ